jgi:AcrR family transcriptional regulator
LDSEDIKSQTGVDPRLAGIFAYNGQRKQSSRDSLLASATDLFCSKGYARVSVEDIATQAGVSRVTFYRHFPTKTAVALELFQRAAEVAAPRMLAIGAKDFRDRATVVAWLNDFFELNREMQGILRVLSQANVEEADFSQQVRPYIGEIIAALGSSIPAFDIDPESPNDQHRWVRAWLLIYTILDQSNHAATVGGISTNPMMVEVLADHFLDFILAEHSWR